MSIYNAGKTRSVGSTPMTSEKKVSANRMNANKSRGPKTLSGKLQSSRNAWRHGLASAADAEPTASPAVKRMAKAICGEEYTDPDLYELAVTIARWQIVLLKVRTTRDATMVDAKIEGPEQLAPAVPSDEESARLNRYERRARSARNRAIRRFQATRIVAPFLSREAKGR
jgi:hypothetical protein